MIESCDYCFSVFDEWLWSYCKIKTENGYFCLCSQCAAEILRNQENK